MCIVSPHQYACGHRHGFTITSACKHSRVSPMPLSSIASLQKPTICLAHLYTPNPNPGVSIQVAIPLVCPQCFRGEEAIIFAGAQGRIDYWEGKKENMKKMWRERDGGIDAENERSLEKVVEWKIGIVREARGEMLREWRGANGVWGDG